MELNNIRLLVENFDECFRFYSETLGLKVSWGKPGGDYASFNVGLAFGLSLFKTDLMAEAIGNTNLPLPYSHREKAALVLKVEDVDKTHQELIGKGIAFINEPTDMTGWGMRAAHFRDPEDNLIEIYSDLAKEKWDKGLQDESKEYE